MTNKPAISVKFDERPASQSSDAPRLSRILGLLRTTTVQPAGTPRSVQEQIVIWDDTAGSGDVILSIYDTSSNTWLGATLTAL